MTTMEAEGYLKQRIVFDGDVVRVVKGRREWSFHVADLQSIGFKGARKLWNGEVRFIVPGASDAPQRGNYWTKTGKDESHHYTVVYCVDQTDAMRAICDAIWAAKGKTS